jgi:hypothetical protein
VTSPRALKYSLLYSASRHRLTDTLRLEVYEGRSLKNWPRRSDPFTFTLWMHFLLCSSDVDL